MTILCERRKLSQEELVALRPVFNEWRRREREKDLLMVEQIQTEEDIKEEELQEIDQKEENCRIEHLEVLSKVFNNQAGWYLLFKLYKLNRKLYFYQILLSKLEYILRLTYFLPLVSFYAS